MQERYLEITYRNGKPLAAYLYLSKKNGGTAECSKVVKKGIVADFNSEDKLIGIEITAPSKVSIEQVNELLNQFQIAPVSEQEWAPLIVASEMT